MARVNNALKATQKNAQGNAQGEASAANNMNAAIQQAQKVDASKAVNPDQPPSNGTQENAAPPPQVPQNGDGGTLVAQNTTVSGTTNAPTTTTNAVGQTAGTDDLDNSQDMLVAQQTPASASWTGRPPQRQPDLKFSFFDDRTGQTVTVRQQPLWKDDNWNLGGYFTVDRNGNRQNISAWSPAAASGQNAREVVLKLLNEGLIDPRNVTVTQTHERQFGGDGGQYWIPTARETAADGRALYYAQSAAKIPTDPNRTIRPDDTPAFAEGYRSAEFGDRVLAGYALFQNSLAIAGSVAAPINTARIQGRGNFEVVNPNTGQRLQVRSNPRTGGITGTLIDRNGVPLATQSTLGKDFTGTITVRPNVTVNQPNPGVSAITTVPFGNAGANTINKRVDVSGTPVTIQASVAGATPTFRAVYGPNGQNQIPLPGATSFEQATQQITNYARNGQLPGITPQGPVVVDSPLTLSSGGKSYTLNVRNTQENGQNNYTVSYRIGGKDYNYSIPGASNLAEASQKVGEAFRGGALPGLPGRGPVVLDNPLTLTRGGQSFNVTIQSAQANGKTAYAVSYTVGGKEYNYALPGASNLTQASQQVNEALNRGGLPGLSSYTPTPLTLKAGGKSYAVTIHNVQIGQQANYSVSYRIGGEDKAFRLPGAANLAQASKEVRDAFIEGRLPGLTPPKPQETTQITRVQPQNSGTVTPPTATQQTGAPVDGQGVGQPGAFSISPETLADLNELRDMLQPTWPSVSEILKQPGIFNIGGAGEPSPRPDEVTDLTVNDDGTWSLVFGDGGTLDFDSAGQRIVPSGQTPGVTPPSSDQPGAVTPPVTGQQPDPVNPPVTPQQPSLIVTPDQPGVRMPFTAQQLSNIAQMVRQAPADLAQKVRGPLLWMVTHGQIPSKWNDVHSHNGGYWGTYDPNYRGPLSTDFYMDRLTRQLNSGKSMQFYFPVAPQFTTWPPGFEGTGAFGAQIPGYYASQTGLFRNNIIGRFVIEGDTARVVEPIRDAYGNVVVPKLTLSRADLETLIGRTIPTDVKELQFVPTPVDCNLHYQGVEADRQSISKLGYQIARERDMLGYSPSQNSHFIGLTGGSPTAPDSYKTIYDGLRYTSVVEEANRLPPGSINSGMMGEITIDKENVLVQSRDGRALLQLTEADLANLDQFVSPMKNAGGVVIIHADVGPAATAQLDSRNFSTFVLPSNNANYTRIKEFFMRNPDQQFIWAHAGASYTGQTNPATHLGLLRDLLQSAPNVKIDLSWTATNKEIFRDVEGWARLLNEFPTRFIWGSDTIAASNSLDPEAIKGPMKPLEKIGFLAALDRINPELKDRFLSQNFLDTLPPAQQRVNQWRTDPWVSQWLANGGYENGTPPPKIWVKSGNDWDNQSDWTLQWNPAAFNTDRPWWPAGTNISPDTPPVSAQTPPVALAPFPTGSAAAPTPTGKLTLDTLWQAFRPAGFFVGASTPVGSGFAVVPRKALTKYFNWSELQNVQSYGAGSMSSLTFYGSTRKIADLPPIPTPFGMATGIVQAAGTANRNKDEAGVNVFYTLPLPDGAGKVGVFFNIRQDWATAAPIVKEIVRAMARRTEDGLPAIMSDFVSGDLPQDLKSVSANFGLMYAVTDPLINAVKLVNPAVGESLASAKAASGSELWIGMGGRADMNFSSGRLTSMWFNDVMIPMGSLPDLLQSAQQHSRAFVSSLGEAHARIDSQSPSASRTTDPAMAPTVPETDVAATIGNWLFGVSPWQSVRQKLRVIPTTGEPILQGGTLQFNPSISNSENIAAQVYTLGVKYGVLRPDQEITAGQAGAVIDQILARARQVSPAAYDQAIGQLTANKYNLDFGSQELRDYYNQTGNFRMDYVRGNPGDYERVRRALQPDQNQP